MSNYGWIIDKDHVADKDMVAPSNCNAPGMMGPRSIPAEIEALLKAGKGREFRIYDDDGELYYEGRFIGPDWETATEKHGYSDMDESAFGPLNDFGAPNAGATSIKYTIRANNTGRFVEL